MAVTKRTRYEVLKRDNHTCRYCGAKAPNAELTVDHVTPASLGGSDDPSNLVAACRDCNAGKGSSSPEGALVADVKRIDMEWAGAIRRVAAARGRARKKQTAYVAEFLNNWNRWSNGLGDPFPLEENWETAVRRFYDLGVPIDELNHCADVACGHRKLSQYDVFRYFAGCTWRLVTEMQDAAKALLTAETEDK